MLHSKPFASRILSDLSDAARGAATLRVVPKPRAPVFNEASESRKWDALYALCRREELLRERLRLEAEATALSGRAKRETYPIQENLLKRRLVAQRLTALGVLDD